MQKNMDSNRFRMHRRLPEILNEGSTGQGAVCVQNAGCRVGALTVPCGRGIKYHGEALRKRFAGIGSHSSGTAGRREYGEHIWIYPGQQS